MCAVESDFIWARLGMCSIINITQAGNRPLCIWIHGCRPSYLMQEGSTSLDKMDMLA